MLTSYPKNTNLTSIMLTENALDLQKNGPRVEGPLGIGVYNKPPIDSFIYDQKDEELNGTLSILSENELINIKNHVDENGYMSIEEIRRLISEYTTQGSEISKPAPEIIAQIDVKTNMKIFIILGETHEVFTREAIYIHGAFSEFGIQPEKIFKQQLLGVFESLDGKKSISYVLHDIDENNEFLTNEDFVSRAQGRPVLNTLVRVVKTKIYIIGQQWQDFNTLQKVARGLIQVSQENKTVSGTLSLLLGNSTSDDRLTMIENRLTEIEKKLAIM